MAVCSVRLVEGRSARLDVGVSLPCRVTAFSGAGIVPALTTEAPEALVAGGRLPDP